MNSPNWVQVALPKPKLPNLHFEHPQHRQLGLQEFLSLSVAFALHPTPLNRPISIAQGARGLRQLIVAGRPVKIRPATGMNQVVADFFVLPQSTSGQVFQEVSTREDKLLKCGRGDSWEIGKIEP